MSTELENQSPKLTADELLKLGLTKDDVSLLNGAKSYLNKKSAGRKTKSKKVGTEKGTENSKYLKGKVTGIDKAYQNIATIQGDEAKSKKVEESIKDFRNVVVDVMKAVSLDEKILAKLFRSTGIVLSTVPHEKKEPKAKTEAKVVEPPKTA